MKSGSLVELRRKTRLEGGVVLESGAVGILLNRTYLAYDPKDTRWTILIKGKVRKCAQSEIIVVDDAGKRW